MSANIFANGVYFKNNPDNILAEQVPDKDRYKKSIITYKGTIDNLDRINASIDITAIQTNSPYISNVENGVNDLTNKDAEQVLNIENALNNSEVEIKAKRKRKKETPTSNTIATSDNQLVETRTLLEVYKEINPEISIEELKVFLWFYNSINKPITNPDWYDIADSSLGMLANVSDSQIKEWYENGLVFYNGINSQIEPAWLYLSGDVYAKYNRVFKAEGVENQGQDIDYIIQTYGKKAYETQLNEIKKFYQMQYDKRLQIGDTQNAIKLLPISKFAKNFFIESLVDEMPFKMKRVTASSDKRYGKPDFLFTGYVRDYDKFNFDKLSLRDAFCYWLVTDKTITFKKGITYADIINFYIFAKSKPKTSAQKSEDGKYYGEQLKIKQKEEAAYERLKAKAKIEGDRLFALFIDKFLVLNDRVRLELEWNMTFNNNVPINYNKIPVAFRMNKYINGQPLDVRPEKREAVAFTISNGSGLLAYDVGVGKTPSAIFTISAFIDLGWAKRPLVVVPNQTYKQWISEFKSFAGHIKINKLYNLNDSVIEDFQDTTGSTLLVDEGSVTIMTYEGMEKLGFNEQTSSILESSVSGILMQDTSGLSDKKAEKQELKLATDVATLLGKALRGTNINIEDLGLDYLCLDEAHACKKVFTSVAGESEENTGNKDKKTRPVVQYKINSGTPSYAGIKGFILCQYIQSNYKGNTQLLTATPFTNSPLEVYSMLAMVGYSRLEKMGLNNLTTFFDTFVDISYELVINAALNAERRQVILGFNNLLVIQQLVRQFINHKTGESVGVKRPNKYVLPYTRVKKNGVMVNLPENEQVTTAIPLTALQAEYMQTIKEYAEGNISFDDAKARHCVSSIPTAIDESGSEEEAEAKDDEGVLIDEGEMDEKEKKGVRLLRALNMARNVSLSPYLFKCDEGLLRPTAKEYIESSGKLIYTMEAVKSIKKYHEKTNTPMSGIVIFSERGLTFFNLIRDYLIDEVGFQKHEVGIISAEIKTPIEKGVSDEEAKEYIKNLFLGKKFNKQTLELEPISNEQRLKVLIGSSTIREGINLQAYSSTLFNLTPTFNPTDIQQLEGRIYRQGNAFKNVRIVHPLMVDSSDIFIYQKLEEKTSRINTLFDTDGMTNVLKTEEYDPKELKYSLIKNPRVIAQMEIMEDSEIIDETITDKLGEVEKTKRYIENLGNIRYYEEKLNGVIEEVRSKSLTKSIENKIKDFQDYLRTKLDEQGRYTKSYSYEVVPKGKELSPYSAVSKPSWFDSLISYVRSNSRFEKDYLFPRKINKDSVQQHIAYLEAEIEDLKVKKNDLAGEDAIDKKVLEVLEKQEKMSIRPKKISELINEFERLNYLLDDVTLPKTVEPKMLQCPPIEKDGTVRIDAEGLALLNECIAAQPQTKFQHTKEIKLEDGSKGYEYTPERKELHKRIIKEITRDAVCTEQIEPIAIIMGGAPGSGKSTFINNNAPYLASDLIWKVDADEVRGMLPEYKGWNSPATHEESKDVVNQLLDSYDKPCKHDLLYDGTMSNVKKYRPLIKRLKQLGYKVFLVFMDVPKEVSIQRALLRYKNNVGGEKEFGRYVPLSVIEDFYGTGDEAFQLLKKEVDGYVKVDGLSQDVLERGGMQIPENRAYFNLGDKLEPKAISKPTVKEVVEEVIEVEKPTPLNNIEFIEKRIKALQISLRFSKDKEFIEKRIKALEISLKVLKAKERQSIPENNSPLNKIISIMESKINNQGYSLKALYDEVILMHGSKDGALIFSEFIKRQKDIGNNKLIEEFNKTSFVENINKTIEYDWDVTFTGGISKGQKLSEKVIDYIDVYDDFIYNLEFKEGGNFQATTKETVGLLSITDNVVKLAVILDDDVFSSQRIIRRLQKVAQNSGRVIVDNDDLNRSERRSFPYLLVKPKDADKYTVSKKFEGKLETPRKEYVKNAVNHIATFVDEKNNITYKVRKSHKTPGRFEVVESSKNWKEDNILEFVSEEDALEYAKLGAGIIKERDPEEAFMFNKDKFAGGGNIQPTLFEGGGQVHIVDEGQSFDESRYPAVFADFDEDGVVNIDDAYPNDPARQGFVEKVRLEPIFKKLIDLKSKLNTVMFDTVEELKDKSPKTADIYARTKTPFSILKKLVDKRLLDEAKGLTDLVGTTIAVDSYSDLLKVKSEIESGILGKVIDFDDFYAKPKAGYMAYHFIVKTNEGYTVEVQLKTKRMKNLNKVSHEFYKLGNLDSANFLKVTELTHRADMGDKEAIKQYDYLMYNKELLRKIMTGDIVFDKDKLFSKGGNISDKEIFESQFS